jgi:hypothetical protein
MSELSEYRHCLDFFLRSPSIVHCYLSYPFTFAFRCGTCHAYGGCHNACSRAYLFCTTMGKSGNSLVSSFLKYTWFSRALFVLVCVWWIVFICYMCKHTVFSRLLGLFRVEDWRSPPPPISENTFRVKDFPISAETSENLCSLTRSNTDWFNTLDTRHDHLVQQLRVTESSTPWVEDFVYFYAYWMLTILETATLHAQILVHYGVFEASNKLSS